MRKSLIAFALVCGVAAIAYAATFPIRATRTITGLTTGTGVSQVCAVASSAPEVPLEPCASVDPVASDVAFTVDVTSHMVPGVRSCFKAVSIGPEGLISEPSDDEACGTIPAKPRLQ